MGNPSSNEHPEIRLPAEPSDGERGYVMPASPPPVPVTRHVVLFVLTFITTTLVGAEFYASFLTGLDNHAVAKLPSFPWLMVGGLWFSVGVLAILGIHEFGHYFACKYYRVDASLPYFLPMPIPFVWPGTLGAVIRIRQPIASKLQFFDIGIAGPIAGFLIAVPILLLGMSLSTVVTLPQDFDGTNFNDPLLFKLVARLFFPSIPNGQAINLHPAGWAAWWGLLATALNLCPVGQLDGGHVSYAVFGRKSSMITLGVAASLIGLTMYSLVVLHTPSYLLWTVLLIIMLSIMGPHHPRTYDEDRPLDGPRLWLAAFAAFMLIVSFTPIPIAALTTGR
jgi:membrane-associated protease RseP (regulator of RpoE activity)